MEALNLATLKLLNIDVPIAAGALLPLLALLALDC